MDRFLLLVCRVAVASRLFDAETDPLGVVFSHLNRKGGTCSSPGEVLSFSAHVVRIDIRVATARGILVPQIGMTPFRIPKFIVLTHSIFLQPTLYTTALSESPYTRLKQTVGPKSAHVS